jgi:hypothetical protein
VAVSLTKPTVPLTLANELTVKCPRCQEAYRVGYSDDEWNRVKDLLAVAERTLREDHKRNHELSSLTLNWNPIRGQR